MTTSKIIIGLGISFVMLSCSSNEATINNESKESQVISEKVEITNEVGRNNYAVIWEWTTDAVELVDENAKKNSDQTLLLYDNDIIEDVYYDSSPQESEKLSYFPSISYFIKAYSKNEAKEILDTLNVVTKGIAKYEIYPVGMKWLGRKNSKTTGKTFVAVWTTIADSKTIKQDLIQEQNDSILSLWEKGVVENVYFDIEGSNKGSMSDGVQDFVFYVNAETKEGAQAVCEALPFFKNDIAVFSLFPAGVFWLGENEEN